MEAIAAKRAGLALAPRNKDYLDAANTTHIALIETLIRLREPDGAASAISELLSLAPDSGPQCFRAGSLLARCVPLASADAHAPLPVARRNELAKTYADRAVELLREAKKRGHQDVEVLESDHSFDAIRSRADFRELLTGSVAPAAKRRPVNTRYAHTRAILHRDIYSRGSGGDSTSGIVRRGSMNNQQQAPAR